MWGVIGPLIKQFAQQRLSQGGLASRIGSTMWQDIERRRQQQLQAEQFPAGGYLPQQQMPIKDVAAGGYLPPESSAWLGNLNQPESFADLIFKILLNTRR